MRLARWTIAALAGTAVFTAAAFSQDKEADMAEGMKRWNAACALGAHHKELARFIGNWDTEMSVMGSKSKGTSEFKWLYEGRWVVCDSKGTMMGMPVSSHRMLGYDNFKKKFVSSQVDSFTTVVLTSEGNFDRTGQALITYGLMDEPMDGEHDKHVKYVWRFLGPDKMVQEVHDLAIGESDTKVIEWVYTRRK